MDLSEVKSALVIKPSSFGDVVQTLPAVNLLARRYPDLALHWVVDPRWGQLLEGHPALAGIVPFPRENFRGPAGWGRFLRWARDLRDWEAGVAFDFQGLLRSGLMARFSGAGLVLGMSDAREGARFFFDEIVTVERNGHAVRRYLALAEAAGAAQGDKELEYRLPAGEAPAAAGKLEGEDFVLLHPYARGRGKALDAALRRRFCEVLAPARVVLAGIAPEGEEGAALPSNALDLSGRAGLPELIWLMRQARFCVSTDSGPMHLAAALTGDLLGIHTWTDPRVVGPARGDAWVWKAGAVRRVGDLAEDDGNLAGDRSAKVSGLRRKDVEAIASFVAKRIG